VEKATRRFLTVKGGWTDLIEEAMEFTSFSDLWRACREYQLKDVEILMQRSGSEAAVTIPLRC